ncbi:hypothetical protein FOL47_007452 [Perkinsus chesapeaki]|uniref:Zinc finger MYM-type protein 1 n=1 Tax=Perkinsus chesapeaki TaxID=330153 RepID=A0A7J6MWT5_PERCH|nr:hypothetical protein FOL47_007452 [Perkinsus chesapeaki]
MAMVKTGSSTANALKDHLVSFLEQNGLSICDLRGQGYDGCSTMSGCTSGVAVQMSALQPRAKYVHCSGHRLNLTLQDGIRNISNKESRSAFEDVLATCSAFSSFVRDSPKRLASLEIFCNKDGSRGRRLRPVCPTRWVLRVGALQALTSNYSNGEP